MGSPGSQNRCWRHLGSAKGQPEALKRGLAEPNTSHRGCLETSLDSLGAAWEALGPAWKTPRDHFGAKVDPKLDDFAASFFDAVFLIVV